MRVRVGSLYRYTGRSLYDVLDGHKVSIGTVVRVINLPSAPPANTMGQCYVADRKTGEFLAMVSTDSLEPARPRHGES